MIYQWWQNIASEYQARFGNAPKFYYDNIVNLGLIFNAADRTLTERTVKYPAVFLLAGIMEDVRRDGSARIKPRILIVTNSKRDYLFSERQQKVYEPTLYPIVNNLITLFRPYKLQNYRKIDRDYISGALREASQEAGVSSLFNDSLDGVELICDLVIPKPC